MSQESYNQMIAGRFFQGFIVDPHIVLAIDDVQIRSTDILRKI